MFKGIMGLLAGAVALAQPVAAQAPDPVQIRTAVLRVDDPGLPPISRLDLMPADLGFAGARLAIEDNDTTGRFMGQDFEAEEVAATPETAEAEMARLLDEGVQFIVLLADDATTLALADQAGDRAMVFNAMARGDNLRGTDCRFNTIHVAPSRAMLTDAMTQFLMWKNWPRWFLIHGSHPEDQALAQAWRTSAAKFGAQIVEEREYTDTGGARRTDSGHVQVQAQMPVFTQRAADHDVVIAADEADVFAAYLPYLTWDARPVAGSAGLVPRSWHSRRWRPGAAPSSRTASRSWPPARSARRITRPGCRCASSERRRPAPIPATPPR